MTHPIIRVSNPDALKNLSLVAVIFDFDDTIAKPPIEWQQVMADFFCKAIFTDKSPKDEQENFSKLILKEIREKSGTSLSEYMERLTWYVKAKTPHRAKLAAYYRSQFDKIWQELTIRYYTQEDLLPGILNLLESLHRMGIELYVLTGGDRNHKLRLMKKLGLSRFVPERNIYGDTFNSMKEVFHKKIAIGQIRKKVFKKYHLYTKTDKNYLAVIGDGKVDMESAKSYSNIISIGFNQIYQADIVVEGVGFPPYLLDLLFPKNKEDLLEDMNNSLDLKKIILNQLEAKADIFWDFARIKERAMLLPGFPTRVRFIPTFAYRQLNYDNIKKNYDECRLCQAIIKKKNIIRLEKKSSIKIYPDPNWSKRFLRRFVLMANNFPYFNHQFLLSCRQHQEIFTAIDFMYIFQFLWITRFRCTLLQIEGSGATIRSHAHINICDESIPLFQVKKEIFYSQGDIKIYTSSTFNHSFYVISCDNLKRKSVILENILKKVRDVYHLSYNLFIDSTNDVYIILRKCEYSKKLKRKIGSVEASGLFLGNALGCRSLSIKRLESDIKHRCDRLTPENFSQALDQCLCSKNEGRFLEKLIIETIYVTK